MKSNRLVFSTLLLFICLHILAQFNKSAYYAGANGLKGAALKSALANIIKNHTTVSYDGLLNCYKTTDVRDDGKLWDMYSDATNYVIGGPAENKSYKKEGDSYNREHSIPQSVFNEGSPMKSDIYHVVPTDGYINNMRSNYPYGEVGTVTKSSNNQFCKLGSPTSALEKDGCNANLVFEPADMYKGDFARIYFYFVTCYESRMSGFKTFAMFENSKSLATYPSLTSWAQKLLLKWSQNDPVSTKETVRGEECYKYQKNRNPFTDFPGLEQYIWGSYKDIAFSVENYVNPYDTDIDPDQPGVDPDQPGVDPDQPTIDPETPDTIIDAGDTGDYAYVKVSENLSDWKGEYLIVYEAGSLALNCDLKSLDADNNSIAVTIKDDVIEKSEKVDAAAVIVDRLTTSSYYSVKTKNGVYLGMNSTSNGLVTGSEVLPCNFTLSGSEFKFVSNLSASTKMYLRYNKTAKRFRFYKSGQEPVVLYKKTYKQSPVDPDTPDPEGPDTPDPDDPGSADDPDSIGGIVAGNASTFVIFDMTGRRLERIPVKGIYIMNGRKYVR